MKFRETSQIFPHLRKPVAFVKFIPVKVSTNKVKALCPCDMQCLNLF